MLPSYVLATYLLVQVLSKDILIIRYFGVLENWCHLALTWLIANTLVLPGVLTVQLIPLEGSSSRERDTLWSFTKNLCIKIIRHRVSRTVWSTDFYVVNNAGIHSACFWELHIIYNHASLENVLVLLVWCKIHYISRWNCFTLFIF